MLFRTIPLISMLILLAFGFAIVAVPLSHAQSDVAIATQIARLGSPEFRERMAAERELDRIGAAALPALRRALATSDDPEVRQRAEELITRISRRAEAEEILAPTMIRLTAGTRSLAAILDEFRQQTDAEFRIDARLAKETEVTVPAGEPQPFWTALEAILDLAGFEITPASNQSTTAFRSPETVAADLKRLTDERIAVIEKLQAQMKNRARPGQNAKDIEEIDKIIQAMRKDLQENLQQMAALQARQVNQRPQHSAPSPLPSGIITLQPRIGENAPRSIHGAARITPVTFPESARATVPADQFPLILQLATEPKLRCLSIETISIRSAVDDQGRELAVVNRGGPLAVKVQPIKGGNIVVDANGGVNLVPNAKVAAPGGAAAFQPNPLQVVAILARPDDGPTPRKLQSLTGHLRAIVNTPEKVLAKLNGLKPGEMRQSTAGGPVSLETTLSEASQPGRYELRVVAKFDPDRLTPRGETGNHSGMTIIQGQGGGVVVQNRVMIINGRQIGSGSAEALTVQDAQGRAYELSVVSSSTQMIQNGNTREYSQEYRVRAVAKDPNAGPPSQIAFRGQERKSVEIPFNLANLPLIPGTGPRSTP